MLQEAGIRRSCWRIQKIAAEDDQGDDGGWEKGDREVDIRRKGTKRIFQKNSWGEKGSSESTPS